MANPNPTPPTPPQPLTPPKLEPESCPVAILILEYPIDGIAMNGLNGLKTSPLDAPIARPRHVIRWVPEWRHHEIAYYPPNATEPELHYVCESKVKTWKRAKPSI